MKKCTTRWKCTWNLVARVFRYLVLPCILFSKIKSKLQIATVNWRSHKGWPNIILLQSSGRLHLVLHFNVYPTKKRVKQSKMKHYWARHQNYGNIFGIKYTMESCTCPGFVFMLTPFVLMEKQLLSKGSAFCVCINISTNYHWIRFHIKNRNGSTPSCPRSQRHTMIRTTCIYIYILDYYVHYSSAIITTLVMLMLKTQSAVISIVK